ncbi:hypothetical protein BV898_18462 [Hypsibius exemplaris]|uniref:Phosphatidylinositol-glycan biosynthesis class F protein n=1 Tax=Hypsibius exemplaris TaxID=2072580 RepID=A0A9X6NHM4_HYPEX|nr:hypothetical protein BV898_18462 [Hypsibius exemplaris]
MSLVKARRRLELNKLPFSLGKATLSLIPLLPCEWAGGFFNLVENPVQMTLVCTFLFLLMDSMFFRSLFLEDLTPRRGPAGNKNAAWSGTTAYGMHLLTAVPVIGVGVILFGAPITEAWGETAVLAVLLAIVSFAPFCHVFVHPFNEMMKLLQSDKTEFWNLEKASLIPGLVAAFGAWSGAIVIPLDWDRPWQKWPIPCCFGAFTGYTIANFAWFCVLSWKLSRRPTSKFTPKGE